MPDAGCCVEHREMGAWRQESARSNGSNREPAGAPSPDDAKRWGRHYTPRDLAEYVATQTLRALEPPRNGRPLRILDPALGDGILLEAVGGQLLERGNRHFELHGFETDAVALSQAYARLSERFGSASLFLREADFLVEILQGAEATIEATGCDIVIANPPYVRTQILGASRARQVARDFGLRGRVDLYQAFLLGIARSMRAGGSAGLIVPNRILTTRAGAVAREALLECFDILHVCDLGDTKVFAASVLPTLLFLRRTESPLNGRAGLFTSIYSTRDTTTDAKRCPGPVAALETEGVVSTPDGRRFRVRHGSLDTGRAPGDVWRRTDREANAWLETVSRHTACRFGDIGKVRVGVKTTADSVFIRSDWDRLPAEERPELLRPLLTHREARRFSARVDSTPRRILYPHDVAGAKRVAVDLDDYPGTRRYLERHRHLLERREYLLKAGRAWYEIWVSQNPAAWGLPKLVFRDISEAPVFWMDLSGAIVNGDCYWLSATEDKIDLLWLALGVANSRLIEVFYDYRFHNKLYAAAAASSPSTSRSFRSPIQPAPSPLRLPV